MTPEEPLHKQLASLRDIVHSLVVKHAVAAYNGHREDIARVQEMLRGLWREWEQLEKKVAKLEGFGYTVQDVLAASQDDADTKVENDIGKPNNDMDWAGGDTSD